MIVIGREKVLDAMMNKRWEIKDFADIAKIPEATMYNFLKKEKAAIRLNTLYKICDALGVKPEELIESYTSRKESNNG